MKNTVRYHSDGGQSTSVTSNKGQPASELRQLPQEIKTAGSPGDWKSITNMELGGPE